MSIVNNCKPKSTDAKIMTKQTGKGATLVYLADPATGIMLPAGKLMTIGNKTGNIFRFKNVNKTVGMTIGNKTGNIFRFKNVNKTVGLKLDCYGRLNVVSAQGKASRC